jgi:hypothetical protein
MIHQFYNEQVSGKVAALVKIKGISVKFNTIGLQTFV